MCEMRPGLLERDAACLGSGERGHGWAASVAEPPSHQQRRHLIDLALGAVQGTKHLRLGETERPSHPPSTQLISLHQAKDRTLAFIQLTEAIVYAADIGGRGSGVLHGDRTIVSNHLVEEFADWELAA